MQVKYGGGAAGEYNRWFVNTSDVPHFWKSKNFEFAQVNFYYVVNAIAIRDRNTKSWQVSASVLVVKEMPCVIVKHFVVDVLFQTIF